MADPDSTPHEYVDAEMAIEGMDAPTDEKKLMDALVARAGVRNLRLTGKKLLVEYEPVLIHRTQIVEAIQAAGFRVGEVEAAPASPLVDALREDDGAAPQVD